MILTFNYKHFNLYNILFNNKRISLVSNLKFFSKFVLEKIIIESSNVLFI